MTAELNVQLDLVNDRIEAGMAWLDVHVPDWWLDVNAHALAINDGERCVLGQLAARNKALQGSLEAYAAEVFLLRPSGYQLMAGLFDLGWDEPRNLGFLGSDLLTGEEYGIYTNALEARWFTVIIGRQAARLLPGMAKRDLALA